MAAGKGFAKLILFGEHFVVYGLPGIAAGINKYATITIEKIEGDEVIIDDPKFYKETAICSENPGHIKCRIFKPIIDKYNLKGIKATFGGTSVPGAGMGFSASLAVAFARATSEFLGLNLSDDEINELAYECEKVSHGTPSGIDNTCATYGGLIWFEKNMEGGENKVEQFNLQKPLLLVIGDTGKKGSTKELVEAVKQKKQSNQEGFEPIFNRAGRLVKEAREALEKGEIKKVGALMDENQKLLEKIGVSTYELERLCKIAKNHGALGAKLVGAGGGGLMIALVDSEEKQEEITKKFEAAGFKAIQTKIE